MFIVCYRQSCIDLLAIRMSVRPLLCVASGMHAPTDWLSAYPEVLPSIPANPSNHDVRTRHASVWRNAEPYPSRRTDIYGKIDSLLVDVRIPVHGESSSGVVVQRDTITIFPLKLKSTASSQNGQQQ